MCRGPIVSEYCEVIGCTCLILRYWRREEPCDDFNNNNTCKEQIIEGSVQIAASRGRLCATHLQERLREDAERDDGQRREELREERRRRETVLEEQRSEGRSRKERRSEYFAQARTRRQERMQKRMENRKNNPKGGGEGGGSSTVA